MKNNTKLLKKALSIAISLALIMTFIQPLSFIEVKADTPTDYWTDSGNYDVSWYVGHESDTNFTLSTAGQLAGLSVLVSGLNGQTAVDFSGKIVSLISNDILDLSAHLWTSIGYYKHPTDFKAFNGTFNGNSHMISGLTIIFNTEVNSQGLFGYSTGIIQNFAVSGNINASRDVGGIVGRNAGTVSNCNNAATINAETNVGGIAGSNSGTIEYCINIAAITSTSSRTGGITGDDCGTTKYCYNTGDISASNYVGGIIGDIYNSTIECCYNIGAITETNSAAGGAAGGIAGQSYDANTIKNCYNIGNIAGTSYQGGIVGYDNTTNTYENCYYTGCHRGTNRTVTGISPFVPALTKTTLAVGETAEITGVTGVDELKPYFGNNFAITGNYALGTNATGKLTLSSGTITAVGTTEEYQLAPVKLSTITVTQNGLTPTGFDGGSGFISRNINEPSNIYISMPATLVTVGKADNPLQVTCASFTYDGTTSATPSFTTNVPDVTFTYLNKDTNMSYYGGGLLIDPGRYTVTVRTPATANYNAAEASADFEIYKADTLAVTFPTASQISAGDALSWSHFTGGLSYIYGTYDWEDSSIVPSGSDSESTLYNVIFTPSTWATDHYTNITPLSKGITVKVNKRVNTLNIRCNGVSFGSVPAPTVTTNTGGGAVTYEYKLFGADDSTYSSTPPTAIGQYMVRGTSDETADYQSATATWIFNISKKYYPLAISCPDVTFGTPVVTTIENNPENYDVTLTYYSFDPDTWDEEELSGPPTEIGTYYVMATTEETAEYSQGNDFVDFEIKPVSTPPTPPTPQNPTTTNYSTPSVPIKNIPEQIKDELRTSIPTPVKIADTSNNEFSSIKSQIILSKATDKQKAALKNMTEAQINAEIKKAADAISTVNTTGLTAEAKAKIERIKKALPVDTKILPINFTVHAEFAFPVEVSIQLDKYKYPAGIYRLYYYNPVTKLVEDCGEVMVDANGLATFTISHCSDYFISSATIDLTVANTPKTATDATIETTVVTGITKNPITGENNKFGIISTIAIASLTALAVVSKKLEFKIVKKAK